MRGDFAVLTLVATLAADIVEAQSAEAGRSGPRVLLPRDREIALARSAAPSAVSRDATVMVLTDRGFEVGARGTNGRDLPGQPQPSPESRASLFRR
jgi:hypothetical protein